MSDAKRIEPDPPSRDPRDAEHPEVWGFADSGFTVTSSGAVSFTGARYPISGQLLPDFLPWARDTIDAPLAPGDVHVSGYPTPVPERVADAAFEAELGALLRGDQATIDAHNEKLSSDPVTGEITNPATWVRTIRTARATVMFGVPTLFLILDQLGLLTPQAGETIRWASHHVQHMSTTHEMEHEW